MTSHQAFIQGWISQTIGPGLRSGALATTSRLTPGEIDSLNLVFSSFELTLCVTWSLDLTWTVAPFIIGRTWGLKTQCSWSNSTCAWPAAERASSLMAEGLGM